MQLQAAPQRVAQAVQVRKQAAPQRVPQGGALAGAVPVVQAMAHVVPQVVQAVMQPGFW